MKPFIAADNIISSLGFDTEANMNELKKSLGGIRLRHDEAISPVPFYASCVDTNLLEKAFEKTGEPALYTRLEKMFILSIQEALRHTRIDVKHEDTLLIICTTKGNIDLLETKKRGKFNAERVFLWEMAGAIAGFFGNPNEPLVVSNACISGILGIITASRLLQSSTYKNIIVAGGDIISEFTVSGFQAFKAISPLPCRPFDAMRDGITLGEGCATLVLTKDPAMSEGNELVCITGGAVSNDANHISGPSRDGGGLYLAIRKAMLEAEKTSEEIDYISGHGTATVYNDEMEGKAITLAGLQHVPINSFKGYFGHTLGAAGLIESIAAFRSLKENILIPTLGYAQPGTSSPIHVIDKLRSLPLKHCIKTGAGFGGCNAAIVLSKTAREATETNIH